MPEEEEEEADGIFATNGPLIDPGLFPPLGADTDVFGPQTDINTTQSLML